MCNSKNRKSDYAVVGVVTAILLLGLVVAVISLVQTVYVPKMMEEREAEHMEEVSDQFTRLKYAIDSQTTVANPNLPVVTSITLGSKELPYLLSVRAFGSLDILSDSLVIGLDDGGPNPTEFEFGTIKYSSANSYFINQDYIYETGVVIVSQLDGYMALGKPSFSVVYTGASPPINPSLTITNIVDVIGVGEKISSTGYGTVPIQTEYEAPDPPTIIQNVQKIIITTSYPDAWESFIVDAFDTASVPDDKYEINDLPGGDGKEINFVPYGTGAMDVSISFMKINTQIGPGWIE
jgi:hypothetical protein